MKRCLTSLQCDEKLNLAEKEPPIKKRRKYAFLDARTKQIHVGYPLCVEDSSSEEEITTKTVTSAFDDFNDDLDEFSSIFDLDMPIMALFQ